MVSNSYKLSDAGHFVYKLLVKPGLKVGCDIAIRETKTQWTTIYNN